MRKYIYYLTTIAMVMFFMACSNEPIFSDVELSLAKEGVISLKAAMPEDDPITRVALAQDKDMAVALTWEEGDQLELVFVQGDIKVKQTVTVGTISADKKNASFDIVIPTEITGDFDLYGVYGGGGLSDDNPTLAVLPKNTGDSSLLDLIQEKKDVMLHFASKDMKTTALEASVNFEHLGSLVGVILKNASSEALAGLKEMRLTGIGEDANWAYNSGEGGKTYNLETGEFEEINSGGNYISFNTTGLSMSGGETATLWSWSPMVGKTWPQLKLEVVTPDDKVFVTSSNTKPVATSVYTSGKVYYYNAEWDGVSLEFKTYKTPNIFVKTSGVETNDGTSWAAATTLSKALEIMEAGDEIHIAAGTYLPTNMVTGGDKEGDKTFEIHKNVTLIGGYPADATDGAVASKANETILSGNKKSFHTVTVTAPAEIGKKITIKNLTIKDGLAGTADDGILTINGVNFDRSFGGGLSIGVSVLDVIDCVISDNEAELQAAGVFVHSGAIVKFMDSDIINNIARTKNCGGLWNSSITTLIGCNISNNTALGGVSGGIYSYEASKAPVSLFMYNSTVSNNKASAASWAGGGGLYARESSYTRIVNSTFFKNEAGVGGGIRIYTAGDKLSTADIISTTVYDNTSLNGGGIETQPGTTVNIHNSIITGNTATTGKDFTFAEGTTKFYTVLSDKVLDKDGNEVAGKVFDHTTMINEMAVNGTCMISGSSPAATMGMDATLLQALSSTFTPAIENNIIENDQLGNSRSGNNVMGAVVPSDIEDPTPPEVGLGIKEGSDQVLWAKKLKEDLGVDTLQATGGMAVTNDYVVLNTRGLESIYLNRMTGEKLGTLNMSNIVVPGGLNNFYNTADDDGNILICNLAPNAGSFKIWKVKDITSTPELYIEHDEGLKLGRKISIKGSIEKDAIITAPIYAEGQQFLRWQVKDGALVSTTPDKITINGIEGNSWGNHADIVYTDPSDKNSDYFVAYYTQPYKFARVNGTTNTVKDWGPAISTNWVVNAVDYTIFNDRPYVVHNTVNPFTWGGNDSALLFDAGPTGSLTTSVWEAPTGVYGGKENGNGDSNGNGTGDVALKVSEDGSHLHLYFFFTNGQVVCMQFDAKTE